MEPIKYDPCFSCGGPFHPSTGDYDAKFNVKRCGIRITYFVKWFVSHSKRKWGKIRFYNEAITSIKPRL